MQQKPSHNLYLSLVSSYRSSHQFPFQARSQLEKHLPYCTFAEVRNVTCLATSQNAALENNKMWLTSKQDHGEREDNS